MNVFYKFTLCILCILLVSCIKIIPTEFSHKKITIIGNIELEDAQKVVTSINTPPTTNSIFINSGGGNELATLLIAQEIAKHEIDVYINGACISACAHLILPAAKNVYLTNDSIIGFHTNIFGWLPYLWEHDKTKYQDKFQNGLKIWNFLDANQANIDLLFCSAVLHDLSPDLIVKGPGTYSRRAKYRFILANEKMLKAYGVNILTSDINVQPIEQRLAKSNISLSNVRYDWSQQLCENIDSRNWHIVKQELKNQSAP